MKKKIEASPAVGLAKRNRSSILGNAIRLSTGVWVKITPVSPGLLDEAQSFVQDPEVPMWYNEDKDRHEPNPNDPAYHDALLRAEQKRSLAVIDAIIMFGIDLVNEDGSPTTVPTDLAWISKLKLAERRGFVNLSPYNLDDPIDLEYLYKRNVAVSAVDLPIIMAATGLAQEDVDTAIKSFRSET
jgi:hypothetical protein